MKGESSLPFVFVGGFIFVVVVIVFIVVFFFLNLIRISNEILI